MKDGKQNVSFDRWLMRGKDILQILGTLFAILYVGFKYVEKINRLEDLVQKQQVFLTELNRQLHDKRGR